MKTLKSRSRSYISRKQKEETPIVVTAGDYLELYCNECNRKLLNAGNDVFVCGRCGIEFIPESRMVKHGTSLETWDGPIDEGGAIDNETRVSELPEPEYERKKQRKVKGGFLALQQSGIKITNYASNEKVEEDEEG